MPTQPAGTPPTGFETPGAARDNEAQKEGAGGMEAIQCTNKGNYGPNIKRWVRAKKTREPYRDRRSDEATGGPGHTVTCDTEGEHAMDDTDREERHTGAFRLQTRPNGGAGEVDSWAIRDGHAKWNRGSNKTRDGGDRNDGPESPQNSQGEPDNEEQREIGILQAESAPVDFQQQLLNWEGNKIYYSRYAKNGLAHGLNTQKKGQLAVTNFRVLQRLAQFQVALSFFCSGLS